MSWVVDVSRCLGLMDVGSRDVGRRGPGPSAPLRRHAKSSTWLLGSPLSRGSSQGTAAKKRLHRSGSRSTPCLSHDVVPSPKKKQHSVDVLGGRGSLNSTPGNSSVDSLDTDPPHLQPPSSPAPGSSPGRAGALVMTYEPRPRANLARSCEVLGSPEAEKSIDSQKQFATETPARARSVTRLDCSVNYSDSPPLVPPTPTSAKDSPRGVFLEARDTLVSRLLGAGSRGPPLPDTEHPTRVFRARHRFARSDHCLNHPPPQRRVSHHSVTRSREPSESGVGARSRSEHALIRPSWSGSTHGDERASISDWSVWAQDLLDSLHQMNGHANRKASSSSCLASTSSTLASRSSTMASASSTVFSHSTSTSSTRMPMMSRSRGSSGGSIDTQASLADDGSSGLREVNPRAVRRTHSDVGGAGGRGSLHYSRQLSTPQPIKIRPAHRLPQHTASLNRSKSLKRSKGSSHLRRSISQPLDLDKAYDTPVSTLRKCRSPTNTPRRRQRRPSAGNILNEDNTTSEDEIGMSDSEDFRTDLKRSLEEDDDMIIYAEALWDHVTLDCEELVFKAGDLITVIDSSDKDWWWGRISHRAGWFPAAFVRLLVNQEEHQDTSGHQDTSARGPARKLSISGLSHDQIRTNVINEIISTERDFVKHLRDVVEGYLRQVRKRPDMFTDERVSTIFGNMEALYYFQSNFLRELEMCIDWQEPFKSCIGATFIRNREKFEIYSEYCNNHPSAVSSLQELYQDQKYVHFFEACRLLQEMIDISLDGFLLTPVQKICKYPLQLQELLKYTKPDHPDYTSVQGALEAMRDVALLVNERKRRMECLEKIASWQITVEGWEGPELLEDSSQLIYQGEVTKGVGGSWPKEVTLFLFDHQLVYCKRDLLKRNTFVYRGRLNLDNCEIVDLPDGKDSSLNINVHNGWKIHSFEKNKWYVFSCKTTAEKQKWMEAFKRERELVAEDESAGFVVADKAKHLAKVAARNQKNRPKRPRSLWFSFGGHKKGRGSGRTLSQIQHHPV
nr:spermatogenesis-associated protein 13-like isoform X2 [Penaeus vannamei]